MLNGTLCATERALCCIVENYQTPEVCLPSYHLAELEHSYALPGTADSRSPEAIHARPGVPAVGKGAPKNVTEEESIEEDPLDASRIDVNTVFVVLFSPNDYEKKVQSEYIEQ